MDIISACLDQLRRQRAQLDAAIANLEALHTTPAPEKVELRKPRGRKSQSRLPKVKRGRRPKLAGVTTMSPSLTCMECNPPQTFKSALGLGQHKTWRHIGRKGQEKSLQSSTLTN
jgi:hypothetical protein